MPKMNNFEINILQAKTFLLLIFSVMLLLGCAKQSAHPLYNTSNSAFATEYTSFAEYVAQTEQILIKNRHFLTQNQQDEIKVNLPFELKPKNDVEITKGVLLVHGLGDSPYSFVDIAKALAEKGFLVRTVLLTGHGTRPADLINASYKDWNNLVAKHVALLKNEVKDVYLGGFSTGANLVYSYAVKDYDIKGLFLFSPAFQSNEPLLFMTPLLALIEDWVLESDPVNHTNYARYMVVPTRGFAEYYKTSRDALNTLEDELFTRPVLMVLSEHDSVLESWQIKELFDERFINSKSRLIWYGHNPSQIQGKTRYINSDMPEYGISNMSHMGILFSPQNPYYGQNGSERICINAPNALQADIEACKKGAKVKYSSWVDDAKGKPFHARLTFNPEFDTMMQDLFTIFAD